MLFFMCVQEIHRPVVYEVVEEDKNLQVLFEEGTVMKYLTKEAANDFEFE